MPVPLFFAGDLYMKRGNFPHKKQNATPLGVVFVCALFP